MISPTTITIFYGSSSNVAADLNGQDPSQFQQNIRKAGGYQNGDTFIPFSTITSMVAS